MNEEMNSMDQRLNWWASETGLSPDFLSRCLDGDMDALATLDENGKQFAVLLGGIPLFFRWWLVLYETSLPEFDVTNLSWEWRLAGGQPILDQLKLLVREMADYPQFVTAEQDEIDAVVREKILECTALSEAQHAEILECSVEMFRKIRRGFSGRGLIRFEPVGEDRFRIHVRWNATVCRDVLLPLAEMLKRTEFFEHFPPLLVQTIQ